MIRGISRRGRSLSFETPGEHAAIPRGGGGECRK